MTAAQLLDYVHDKIGPEAVVDIVFNLVKSGDGELDGVSVNSDGVSVTSEEPTSDAEDEFPTLTMERAVGRRLVKADVTSIRALLDAGKPAIIRRETDGFEARVIKIEGNTIYLDREVSDGKGKASNHRTRHIIARNWRLVL